MTPEANLNEPVQSQPPLLPWEKPDKPPWKPRISGIAGLLCGPMAGALVTFVNLRRLGKPRKAHLVFWLAAVACIGLGYVLMRLPDGASNVLARVVGHIVSPLVFPFLQSVDFAKWRESNPRTEVANGWKATKWAVLGLMVFFVFAMVGAAPVLLLEKVENIAVYLAWPQEMMAGEQYVAQIEIENAADHAQMLHSIEFDRDIFVQVQLEGTEPAFKKIEPVPLTERRSYVFERSIPAKEKLVVKLLLTSRLAGLVNSTFSVCVGSSTNCEDYEVSFSVVPPGR